MKENNIFSLLILFLCLFYINCITAEDKEPFTAEKMHLLNRLSSFVPSPNNQYVVFVNRLWDKESKKYCTNLQYIEAPDFYSNKEKNSALPLNVTIPELGLVDSDPIFSSEFPEYLFFLRTKDGVSNIYYIDFPPTETSQPKQLSSYEINIANLKLLKNTLVFSAEVYFDCDDFACTKKRDDEVSARGPNSYSIYTKLMMRHWDFWYTEGKDSHPFYQKIVRGANGPQLDGTPLDLMKSEAYCSPPLENGAEQFDISPDGNLVAFSAHSKDEKMSYNTKWEIYVYDLSQGRKTLITENEAGRCQNPLFKPNDQSNRLAYLCMEHYGLESDQLSLRLYNPSDGSKESENNKTPQMINSFIWDPQGQKQFILNTVNEGRVTLFSFNMDLDPSIAYKNITSDDNAYGLPIIISNDGNSMLIDCSSFTRATLLVRLDKDETSGIFSSRLYYDANEEEMEKYEMIEPEWFTFIGANNDRIQGWVMKPINFKEGRKYPLAFLVHGGPEGSWEPAWSYRWNPNLWANHGYAVVMINPHGSSGMGIDFQNAVRYNWGGWPFEDLMKGLEYVINNYDFIDEDRVGGCGASYGGYMINWIQGHNDDKKFKCLVTHDGVFSTITMFYATEEMWFPLSEYCPHDKWGCTPYNDDERKGYEEYNPEYFAQNWNTPHLIIHGSKDYRIPVTEGISAFTTLQIRGIPSRFLHFPDENHWVLKPSNSIKWYDEVLGWLDKYLDNE